MIERQRPQPKISVEDLLRLKRAERPASEFWAEFDEQLRRKQLAAIVDKRPWWRRVSVVNLAKLGIPVGTTAVLALAMINVRENSQPAADLASVAPTNVASPVSSPALQVADGDRESRRSGSFAFEQGDHAAATVEGEVLIGDSSLVRASEDNPGRAAGDEPSLAQVILGLGGATESDARPEYESSAELPMLASLTSLDLSQTQMVASKESNSFTQVSSERNERRARLLASVDSQDRSDMISGNSRVARSRERIANRLAEQSLYDSISRLGLNGDSVSIKF